MRPFIPSVANFIRFRMVDGGNDFELSKNQANVLLFLCKFYPFSSVSATFQK